MYEITSWFELQNLYWLLLILPVLIGLKWRGEFGFVGKVDHAFFKGRFRRDFRSALVLLCFTIGFTGIVLALVDITRGFTTAKDELTINRILVAIDNSSSMYNFEYGPSPIYCTDENLSADYPRIYGACRALYRLIDETEAFAGKKDKGVNQKDQIGLIRFALYSFGQVPPTSDYVRLRSVVDELNWRLPGGFESAIGVHTEIHLALWDMFLMAFERNRSGEGGYTHITELDIQILKQSAYPEGKSTPFSLPHQWKEKIDSLKEEMRDTVFILITDALQHQMETRFDTKPVSLKKMLEFAAVLQLPVYFISTEDLHVGYSRLTKETGSGPPGGKYRGDFLMIPGGEGIEHLEELMNSVLQTRFGRRVPVIVERRESYATYFALAALIFFVLGVCFRELFDNSLTEQ